MRYSVAIWTNPVYHRQLRVPRTEERGYLFRVDEIIDLSDLPSPPSDIRACSEDSKIFCFEDSDCSGLVTKWITGFTLQLIKKLEQK